MTKYKNILLILLSVVLFAYAAFISIVPALMVKTFNHDKFTRNALAATGLNITFDKVDLKIEPTFKTIITVTDLVVEFPDGQPVLNAKFADLTTTPACIFGNKIDIKNLVVKNIKYDDLILPDGTNKLAFLPSVLNPKYIGKGGLTIIPGPADFKNIEIAYTKTNPYSYRTEKQREINMTQDELRSFLLSQNFANIKIK